MADPYMYHSPVNFPMTNTPVNLGDGSLGMFYDKFEGGPLGVGYGFGYGGIGGDGYANYSLMPALGSPFESSGKTVGIDNRFAFPAMGAAVGAAMSMPFNVGMTTATVVGALAGFGLNWFMVSRARKAGSEPGSMAQQVAAVATQNAMSALSW